MNAANPLFTVVMPLFKARDTVAAAIASVLTQTDPRFELIVVDDGSPDDSLEVAMTAAGDDVRVRFLRQTNAGPAAARNTGIALGNAPTIAFLDADDRWAPDLLARHAAHFAANPQIGVSFARVCFFDPRLTVPGRLSAHVPVLQLGQAMGENAICTTSNLVARRAVFERVGPFAQTLTHAEDQEWVARVLATTRWGVQGLDAVLVDYRTSTGGLSADLTSMEAGWNAMIESLRAAAPRAVNAAEGRAGALFQRYLARRALRTGQPAGRALTHLCSAFRYSSVALLTDAPMRTLLTVAGVLAALCLPLAPVRAAIAR